MFKLTAVCDETDHVIELGQDDQVTTIIETVTLMENRHIWPEGYEAIITDLITGHTYVYTDKLELHKEGDSTYRQPFDFTINGERQQWT